MSKDIKAGSWWVDVDGDIVYVAFSGRELPFERDEVTFLCYYRSGMTDLPCVIWQREERLVRELPGCTGFDYKVPPKVPPSAEMAGPPQWIPVTGIDGQLYHCLGYLVPTR